jgi:hypothetical protein
MNPPDRRDEDLLGQFLGQIMSGSRQCDAESVNCIKVQLEQLPPCLLAALLRGVYRKYLGIHIH